MASDSKHKRKKPAKRKTAKPKSSGTTRIGTVHDDPKKKNR